MTANASARPARVVHHVPGRLRLRVQGACGEVGFFEGVGALLAGLRGVQSVRVNAASSSVVIQYAPEDHGFVDRLAEQEDLWPWLHFDDPLAEEAGRLAVNLQAEIGRLAGHSHMASAIVSSVRQIDASLREASGGYLDLKLLLPLAVAGASGVSVRRDPPGTPMWLTLMIFAFNSFISLHRARPVAGTVSEIEVPSRSPRVPAHP